MVTAPVVARAAGEASKALTGDIIRIDTEYFRIQTIGKGKGKQEILVPIRVEAHLNPLSVGIGLAAGAVGLLAVGAAAWLFGIGARVLSKEDIAQLEEELKTLQTEITSRENELKDAAITWQARFDECGQLATADRILECRQALGNVKDFTLDTTARIAAIKARIIKVKTQLKIPFGLETRPRFQGLDVF